MRRYGGEITVDKKEYLEWMSLYSGQYKDVDFTDLNNTGTVKLITQDGDVHPLQGQSFWEFLQRYIPNRGDNYLFDDVEIVDGFIRVKFLASDTESPLLWKDRPVFFKS